MTDIKGISKKNNAKKITRLIGRQKELIYLLSKKSSKFGIGGKSENLLFLAENNYLIPRTYVIPYYAFDEYKNGNSDIKEKLRAEIEEKIEVDNCCFSIRSSANIEDSANYSFAGQFRSYLGIVGIDEIIEKIVLIWESFDTTISDSYINGIATSLEKPRMSVIVQEMVNPLISGVLFTKNPLTGLDETIIEYVDGLGDKLVQGLISPHRRTKKWGKWIEKSDENDEWVEILNKLVTEAKEISNKYGKPLDIEWAFDGEQIYWLQIREITTLKDSKLYSNKISRGFLPGIIKPLIWSVNIPVVNTAWKNLFRELIGLPIRKIKINDLAKSFYYRSYFNMGIIGDIFELLGMPRELLEILAGIEVIGADKPKFKPSIKTSRYLPRMLIFIFRKLFYSISIRRYLRNYSRKLNKIDDIKISNLNDDQILKIIKKLFKLNINGSYIVIVSQLLNSLYNLLLKRRLEKENIEFDSLDISDIYLELPDIDPRQRLSDLHKLYLDLSFEDQLIVQNSSYVELTQQLASNPFTNELLEFFKKFGHFRDSGNDFSDPTWDETPEIVVNTIINFTQPPSSKRESNKLVRFKNSFTKFIYKKAKQYLKFREQVNYLYQFGYGLFRPFFLELSYRLKRHGIIKTEEDIFYLKYPEIVSLVMNHDLGSEMYERIQTRRAEIEKYRDAVLPDLIYSDDPPELLSADLESKTLFGVPTSKGLFTGRARIISGRNDFHKVEQGDIIVIPFSDVSWTPLFVKAKAVISQSGGILSHCSIVAREYGIPAIVSVENAMLIKDNSIISVDGFNGKITIIDETMEEK